MQISPLTPKVAAADLPVEKLATNSHVSEADKIAEMSRQFEAVLLRQILGAAQKTVFKSDFTDDSAIGGIYQDMVTAQLAESISKSGSFGLAQSLQTELTRQLETKKDSTTHEN